jgi:membrane protease YdiL (CAAX protease family)
MSTAALSSQRSTAATLAGFGVLWFVMDRIASLTGSLRGESGALVAALVLIVAVSIERLTTDMSWSQAVRSLGLRKPDPSALYAALACACALCLVLPAYGVVSGEHISAIPGAPMLALGIFAQAGLAEEIVFRGFLFRRLLAGRSFWSAVCVTTLPFVAVHLSLLRTLDPTIAAGAIALAAAMSLPLAWLFTCSGGSIWPSAIVHAAAQGIKLADLGDGARPLALWWMLACAVLPFTSFFVRGPRDDSRRRRAAANG